MQDRLSGKIIDTAGNIIAGPQPPEWKGRNKPRRQDRRWVTGWSPQQISQRLTMDFPYDESMRISLEGDLSITVYSRSGRA